MVQRVWAPWFTVLVACSGGGEDTNIGVPIDTSSAVIEDTNPFPIDTSETPFDEEPAHTVQLIETGTWSLSPIGGPYTSLVGTINIIEYIDGPPEIDDTDPIPCEVTISLTGTPSLLGDCPGCDFTFDVLHEVASGDVGRCNDPDRARAGDIRRLGFNPTTGKISWQQGSLWFDWYEGTKVGDQVNFNYTATFGVAVEEM